MKIFDFEYNKSLDIKLITMDVINENTFLFKVVFLNEHVITDVIISKGGIGSNKSYNELNRKIHQYYKLKSRNEKITKILNEQISKSNKI